MKDLKQILKQRMDAVRQEALTLRKELKALDKKLGDLSLAEKLLMGSLEVEKKAPAAPKKKRIKRDMQALEKTAAFVAGRARPTSPARVAKHFNISGAAAQSRLAKLVKRQRASRLERGKFIGK